MAALLLSCSGADAITGPETPAAPVVAEVRVSSPVSTLQVGKTIPLSSQAFDAKGNVVPGITFSWMSESSSVATVSSDGLVVAIAPGSARITASAHGRAASVELAVVPQPVATISVSLPSASIIVGQTVTASATVKDASGAVLTGRLVTWTSTDQAVAKVSETGVITAVAPGTAMIVATSETVTGSIGITVVAIPVASVVVTAATGSIFIGDNLTVSASVRDASGNSLSGRSITWSSTNPSVATVSASGSARGLAAGMTTIIATSEGVSGSMTLAVSPVPVARVVVSAPASSITIGKALTASAAVIDGAGNALSGRTITWSSSNAAVAAVNSAGVITGIDIGSATITAASEGITGSVVVAVTGAARVVIAPANTVIYEHATSQLSADAQDVEGNSIAGRPITWTSSNPTVATVSSTGLIKAVSAGTTLVSAQADGKFAALEFTVRHDPVILVHGFGSSGATWNFVVGQLQADGWRGSDIVAWSYNSLQSNATTAAQLKVLVDSVLSASGATMVDLISHSMGGLPTRYYVKNLGGTSVIDGFVSLAGPNHGTTSANSCGSISCIEMRISSTFLNALNLGDETPGSPRYATWWSPCDAIIIPNESVILTGAVNTQTACVGHLQLHSDANIYAQVREWISR